MDRGKEFSRLVAIELASEGKRLGITQKDIASAAGIAAPQMSFYISGAKGSITVATLLRAAEYLGISPDIIVERAYDVLRSRQEEDVDESVSKERIEEKSDWALAARHTREPKVEDDDLNLP